MAYGLSDTKALELVKMKTSPTLAHPERAEWSRRVFRNAAYLSGIQRFWQNPVTGRLETPTRAVPNRQEFSANIILPYTMRAVSELVNMQAEFSCAPNSDSREDRYASRIADKVFQHYRESIRFKAKAMRAQLHAAVAGIGAIKFSWDEDKGEKERVYLQTKEELAAQGLPKDAKIPAVPQSSAERQMREQAGAFEDIGTGDIHAEVVHPLCLHWDWDAKEQLEEGSTWIAQVTLVEIDKLKEIWGSKARNVTPDEHSSEDTLFEEASSVFHGGIAALGRQQQPRTAKSTRCRVTEYFEVPKESNQYQGRHIVIAGEVVLLNDRNLYAAAGCPLPYVLFQWLPRPGGFVSIDLVGQLTDPQRAYNRSASHSMEVEATNGYPTLVLWKNSGVKPIRIPSFPGQVLEVNQSVQPPVTIPPVNLPPYISENRETRLREMQMITGQTDVTQGAAPGSVRTTGGVDALLGQGKLITTLVAETYLESIAQCGRMLLKIDGMFRTEAGVVKIMGDGNQYDVTTYTGADLRGNYDVRVVTKVGGIESEPSENKVDRLAANGLIDMQDPEMRRLVYDAYHLKSPSMLMDSLLQDMRNAEDENDQFLKIDDAMAEAGGMVPDAMPEFPVAEYFEDHQAHLAVHNRLRKSKEWKKGSEGFRQLVNAHAMQHEAFLQAIQQAQAQAAPSQNASAPGSPDGAPETKGKASPPRPRQAEGSNS